MLVCMWPAEKFLFMPLLQQFLYDSHTIRRRKWSIRWQHQIQMDPRRSHLKKINCNLKVKYVYPYKSTTVDVSWPKKLLFPELLFEIPLSWPTTSYPTVFYPIYLLIHDTLILTKLFPFYQFLQGKDIHIYSKSFYIYCVIDNYTDHAK